MEGGAELLMLLIGEAAREGEGLPASWVELYCKEVRVSGEGLLARRKELYGEGLPEKGICCEGVSDCNLK